MLSYMDSSTSNEKRYLFIGGPRDGCLVACGGADRGLPFLAHAHPPLPDEADDCDCEREVYLPERVSSEEIETVFYRHSELPLDEALRLYELSKRD